MAGRKTRGSDRRDSFSEHDSSTIKVLDSARLSFMFLVFGAIIVCIFARLVYLTLIVGPENANKAYSSVTVEIDQTAKRGTIYDRDGTVLACDVDATTIYCVPSEIEGAQNVATQLATILGGDYSDYMSALSSQDDWAYVAKKADVDLAQKVKDLELSGIYFLDDTKREYPCGSTAGQVVGVCGADGHGLTGLELYYDDILSGTDGQMIMYKGDGIPVAGSVQSSSEAVDGQDIVISIDVDMQEYLESRLAKAVKDIEGEGGNAIVYDASTGDILAMASYPLVDPGDTSTYDDDNMSLTGITNAYEPGSIFKTVTMTAVFEGMDVDPDYEVFCPAEIPADEYYVSDAHDRGDETMSLRTILQNSSNVGVSLISKELGFDNLYNSIVKYKLTDYTNVDYPGESCGYLTEQDTWSTIQSYNVSFGQGIMVTPLQITRFYGALVNDGVECTPHFLLAKPQSDKTFTYEETKVIDNTDVIEPITSMLQSVVSDGTGTDAQIEGFAPAGKTGTAEIASDEGTYLESEYNISFVGYLPDSDSTLVCFVGATHVPGDRTTTAAFRDIMTFAINHYGITPQ